MILTACIWIESRIAGRAEFRIRKMPRAEEMVLRAAKDDVSH